MVTSLSKLLGNTSVGSRPKALLVLEDGSVFEGFSCAAEGEVFGEVCFNTSLEGYLEIISDPSYAGQIITMTYPQSLPEYLKGQNVVAISGIDTRALTSHLRDKGAQRGVISTVDLDPASLLAKVRESESIVGVNLAKTVSRNAAQGFDELPASHSFAVAGPAEERYNVVAYDCGVKKSILQGLVRVGCKLTVVPWDTPAEEVLAMNPDGVFLSNGPGDPDAVSETYHQVEKLIGKVPVFGICLGHQMISLASGAQMEKLKFGHRGGNQPVMNLRTGRVEITAQNHGFGLLFDTLGPLVPELSDGVGEHVSDLRFWAERKVAPVVENDRFGKIQLTHVNLNDGTAEGIAFLDQPVFSVQYHPEASPGPTDAHYLFTAFARLMDGASDYLNIDIASDRLSGWVFGAEEGEAHA